MSTTTKRKYAHDDCYPILIDWTISKTKLSENENTIFNSRYSNEIKNLRGVKCYLRMNLKRASDSGKEAWVFLHLEIPSNISINVEATISCKTANFDSTWTHKYTKTEGCGSRLCLLNELYDPAKNFIVNNQLVVSLKAILKVENSDSTVPKILKSESLGWKLWDNEEDKDATIAVNGMEIKVHKCILKRRSAKFECLFKVKSEPAKKNNNNDKIVVKKHTYDIVKEAIMFCYDIQSSEILSAEDAIDLMKFAHEYQINDLKKNMVEFCIENLSVANAVFFSNSSLEVEAEMLEQECFDFLLKCLKDGTAVKDIEKLDAGMKEKIFLQGFTKSMQDVQNFFN
uniref:BTB domain-containing protein n=1 Tax=Panagrolaimus davidi TaxID=227884 RepID=A0A914QL24_9BILA